MMFKGHEDCNVVGIRRATETLTPFTGTDGSVQWDSDGFSNDHTVPMVVWCVDHDTKVFV